MQFSFENYCLDTDRRELKRGPEPFRLGRKVFDFWFICSKTVTVWSAKTMCLQRSGWPDASSKSTLTSHINAVRKALGRHRRQTAPDPDRLPQGDPVRRQVEFKRTKCVTRQARNGSGGPPLPDRPSIAVPSVPNLSDDPTQDYFADGWSEDIITGLSHIQAGCS